MPPDASATPPPNTSGARSDQPMLGAANDLGEGDPLSLLESLAVRQHGVFSRQQASDVGADAQLLRHGCRARRWHRVAPGVFAFAGVPATYRQRLWVAALHAGPSAVLSHGSAGRLRGLPAIEGHPVELIVERNQTRSPTTSRWHRVDDLQRDHVSRLDGLPVTTAARTIVDLAAVLRTPRVKAMVEAAEVHGQARLVEVAAVLDDVRRRGKPGVARLCRVLDELGGEELARSELERLFGPIVELAGLPEPVHEHPLPSTDGRRGFVDRCWPKARLIVELDGRRWHTRRADIARDHDRSLEAARLGYHTLRLIWERLTGDPGGTAAALRDVYRSRTEVLGS